MWWKSKRVKAVERTPPPPPCITLCFQSPHSCHSCHYLKLLLPWPLLGLTLPPPIPPPPLLPSPLSYQSHTPHNLSLTISGPLTSPAGGAASPPAGGALLDETSCGQLGWWRRPSLPATGCCCSADPQLYTAAAAENHHSTSPATLLDQHHHFWCPLITPPSTKIINLRTTTSIYMICWSGGRVFSASVYHAPICRNHYHFWCVEITHPPWCTTAPEGKKFA